MYHSVDWCNLNIIIRVSYYLIRILSMPALGSSNLEVGGRHLHHTCTHTHTHIQSLRVSILLKVVRDSWLKSCLLSFAVDAPPSDNLNTLTWKPTNTAVQLE